MIIRVGSSALQVRPTAGVLVKSHRDVLLRRGSVTGRLFENLDTRPLQGGGEMGIIANIKVAVVRTARSR
jgi:hypothetical protein